VLGVVWFPELTARRAGARVALREVALELAAAADLRVDAVWIGPRFSLGNAYLDAEGTTAAGARGHASEQTGVWSASMSVAAPLVSQLEAVLSLGAQGHFVRRRFAVNAHEITHVAGARPCAQLALTWRSP
jgi:hypothetical protein